MSRFRHARWADVLDVGQRQLLTPPACARARPHRLLARYFGDLKTRAAASHQGTVWARLIGPLADKVKPTDCDGLRQLVEGFAPHLNGARGGSTSDIWDADLRFAPRGCSAQTWSMAELLRCSVMLNGS